MSVFELYLIFTVLPAINGVAFTVLLFGGFSLIGLIIFIEELGEDRVNKIIQYLKVILPIALILVVIIPSESQLKYIIGGSYVTNIENIEKLPPNMIDAANQFLEKMNEAN
jgi:hypothetical protein